MLLIIFIDSLRSALHAQNRTADVCIFLVSIFVSFSFTVYLFILVRCIVWVTMATTFTTLTIIQHLKRTNTIS